MNNAAAISAQLVDVRNVGQHKCVKLTLHVPAEQAGLVMAAFGWPTMVDPVAVAIARLTTGGMAAPVREGEASNNEARRPPSRNPYQVRAVMLCKDGLFRRWLEIESKLDDVSEEDAAVYIRTKCGVKSRSEILPNTEAATRLDWIESVFKCWRDADRHVEAAE